MENNRQGGARVQEAFRSWRVNGPTVGEGAKYQVNKMWRKSSRICPKCENRFQVRDAAEERCYPCQAGRPAATPYQLPCRQCGVLVWRHISRETNGYCRSCCERPCPLCNEMFWPAELTERFCRQCQDVIRIRKSGKQVHDRTCPLCVSSQVVPLVYGLLSDEARADASAGEFALGGCIVHPGQPQWACRECGHRW